MMIILKILQLWGGYDGVNWEEVTTSKIYSVDSYKTTNVSFAKTEKYTHYRIVCDDKDNPINITSVTLVFDILYTENNYFSVYKSPVIYDVYEVPEKKQTVITLKNIKNIDIKNISIESDDVFSRTVNINTHNKSYELYNLKFKDINYKNTTIEFENEKLNTKNLDEVIIYIENGDNSPINISSVGIEYFSKEIVFEDNVSEKYFINFGGDEEATSPSYDIQKYKDRILENETIDALTIENIQFSEVIPIDENTSSKDEINKIIFNSVIIIVSIILLLIIVLNLRKNNKTNKENDNIS